MNTHKILYVFSAFAVLFGFSACSTDDVATDSQLVGNKVIVKAGIGEGSIFTRSNPVGTEDEQKNFNAGDVINISDGNKSVNYATTDGTTWVPVTPGEYLTWHSDNVTFKAFYPVTYNNTYDVGYVLTDQSTIENINASDFMTVTATKDKEPTDHTLGLQFERKTARVIVNIAGYKNQLDDVKDNSLVLTISGLTSSNSSTLNKIYSYESIPNKQFIALTFPTEEQTDKPFLIFSIDDENDPRKIEPLSYTGIPKFEAGKSYTFNVTLGSDKVTLESVTVENWDTGDPIGSYEATENKVNLNIGGMTSQDITNWLNTNSERIKGSTITLTGAWNDEFYEPLRNAFRNEGNKVTLDMSNVSNIAEIKEGGFADTEGLVGIILPSSVTKIGDDAFKYTGITSINLKNVEEIGTYAFNSTPITSITIPAKITTVTNMMLGAMLNLKEVIFEGNITEFQGNVFFTDEALETIDLSNCSHVPQIVNDEMGTFNQTTPGNITVIVGSEAMKTAFDGNETWKSVGFKEFKAKGE